VRPGPGAYKTEIFGKIDRGDDAARLASYSGMGGDPDKMNSAVASIAGDPNEVADAALEVAQTPFGKRQLRYRIGSGGPGVVERIN